MKKINMLSRGDALELLKANLSNERLFKHCLAVEALMRAIARYLNEDVEKYGLVGLLHDIDYEKTREKPEMHGIVSESILEGRVDDELLRAIKSHNYEGTGVVPKTKLEISLLAADAISGLLVACALIMPNKRLEEVKVKTVRKKFKQKDFARGVNRAKIMLAEVKLGIPLEKFFEISLEALKEIHSKLGL